MKKIINQFKDHLLNENRKLLYVLLAVDLLFIAAHILYVVTGREGNDMFVINKDGGFAEIYQYLKFTFIAYFVFKAASSERKIFYFLSVLFIYLLFDDALRIHEVVGGEYIGGYLASKITNLPSSPYHFGQFIYALITGAIILFFAIWFYKKCNNSIREIVNPIFLLLFLFACFAIGIDVLQAIFDVEGSGLLEDSGEMFTISITAWYSKIISKRIKFINAD